MRHILTILAAVLFLTCPQHLAFAGSGTEENPQAAASALLVASFFHDTVEVVFPSRKPDNQPDQTTALRQILARSIDAGGIGRFILGRYARLTQPLRDPGEDLLDFATQQIMRLAPGKTAVDSPIARPALAISGIADRPNQVQLVMSELVWPDGKRLPLSWEVSNAAGAAQRIEDVNCLGISLRLMLRSAVAEAAAEHPENGASLAALLTAGPSLGHLSPQAQIPTAGQ